MARVPHGSLAIVWMALPSEPRSSRSRISANASSLRKSFRIITRSAVSLLLGSAQSIAYPHSVAGAQDPNA
jgi:hypothetical protein